MKKILKNNKRTKKYLETLPKIYLVGFWARYGVREYYFANKNDKDGIPLVYHYYDGNGTCDLWELVPITHTTCAGQLAYTPYKELADYIANALNTYEGSELYYMGNKANIRYNAEYNDLIGFVNNEKDGIMFKAKTCKGIVDAFHKTVDEAPGEVKETIIGTYYKELRGKKDE